MAIWPGGPPVFQTHPVEMVPGISPREEDQRDGHGTDHSESTSNQPATETGIAKDESHEPQDRNERTEQPNVDAEPFPGQLDDGRLQDCSHCPERLACHHDRETRAIGSGAFARPARSGRTRAPPLRRSV